MEDTFEQYAARRYQAEVLAIQEMEDELDPEWAARRATYLAQHPTPQADAPPAPLVAAGRAP